MGISHLLNAEMKILSPVVTTDSVGGDAFILNLIATYPCRIERINGDREVVLGRMNTEATHLVFCAKEVYDYLAFNQILEIGDRQYDIVDFEDLVHIIDKN
jgi:hypothetical protein